MFANILIVFFLFDEQISSAFLFSFQHPVGGNHSINHLSPLLVFIVLILIKHIYKYIFINTYLQYNCIFLNTYLQYISIFINTYLW